MIYLCWNGTRKTREYINVLTQQSLVKNGVQNEHRDVKSSGKIKGSFIDYWFWLTVVEMCWN